MPGRILKLTDDVIGKIAAGEVVERPAAAVKEMVENSLDAGASAVTVEIRDGGISYIRVTDNGSGIRQNEIRMAFERHATSKIREAQDLSSISTLGFRGEALASIAAVSQVTCTTRTADDPSGVKITDEGGRVTGIEEAACPEGTSMIVRNLFFNTPVRLKFLKKPSTEAGYVSDVMMRMILSRPDVSFRFVSQGKTLYHSAGDGKLESAVFAVYGREMVRTMRHVSGHMNGVVLDGYVGIGESGRSSRSHQSFFINGRYMHSGVLSSALEAACKERVMIGKYPICVLHLTMPYETVDVNVHPNKLEVRFQQEDAVAEAVETLVSEGLRDRDALQRPVELLLTPEPPQEPAVIRTSEPGPTRTVPGTAEAPHQVSEPFRPKAPIPYMSAAEAKPAVPTLRDAAVQAYQAAKPKNDALPVSAQQETLPVDTLPPLRVMGVLFQTYILVEYADQLLMIDQHAVHERLLFDRYSQAYDRHEAGQELLIPLIITVTRREQEVLRENRELLEHLGFAVDPFGDTEVSVRSIPMILGQPQTAGFLHDVLDQLMSDSRGFSMEKRRAAILQCACKHAVKGGERLSEDAIRSLIDRMIRDQVTPTCPHGRPLVVAITHQELDRKFRRIQS